MSVLGRHVNKLSAISLIEKLLL